MTSGAAGLNEARIVIVGAGLCGFSAARVLRTLGHQGSITLVGDESRLPYERPPLSKEVVTSGVGFEHLLLAEEAWFAENGIKVSQGDPAVLVDVCQQMVLLRSGTTLPYDRLLLSMGGRPRTLPGLDAELGAASRTLRTYDDSIRLREQILSGKSLFIIGAGLIGTELAASARALGCSVSMMDTQPTPLSALGGPILGAHIADIHARNGVELYMSASVARICKDTYGRAMITLADGSKITRDLVVSAIGIERSIELARNSGLNVRRGIIVDEHYRTSAPNVFAGGDVAERWEPKLNTYLLSEHYREAMRQGVAAAESVLDRRDSLDSVEWAWSIQFEHRLECAGIPNWADNATQTLMRGSLTDSAFVIYQIRDGRLSYSVGMNCGNQVRKAARVMFGDARSFGSLIEGATQLDAVFVPTTS